MDIGALLDQLGSFVYRVTIDGGTDTEVAVLPDVARLLYEMLSARG